MRSSRSWKGLGRRCGRGCGRGCQEHQDEEF